MIPINGIKVKFNPDRGGSAHRECAKKGIEGTISGVGIMEYCARRYFVVDSPIHTFPLYCLDEDIEILGEEKCPACGSGVLEPHKMKPHKMNLFALEKVVSNEFLLKYLEAIPPEVFKKKVMEAIEKNGLTFNQRDFLEDIDYMGD